MKHSLFFLLALFFAQCINKDVNEKVFFVINYEDLLQNKETVKLTDIASDVKYIKLESGKDLVIFANAEYYFSKEYIFVNNYNHVLVFDYSGKFIRKIGSKGRGPGEIDLIRTISVLESDKILVIQTSANRNLLYYSFDGKFIKSLPVIGEVLKIKFIDENNFIRYYSCSQGNEEYLYILSNEKWDTLSKVNNHYKWINNTNIKGMVGYTSFKPFYSYNNKVFVKSMYNDTVYTILNNKIEPDLYLNLGKYRLPEELRPEPPQSISRFRNENEKYFFGGIMEAGGMIFIMTSNYKAKINRNILYNRKSSEGIFLVDASHEPSGFINDWDGSIEFWPEGSINDQEIFMEIPAIVLKKKLLDESKGKNAFSDLKKTDLKEIIGDLDELDNPVLMIVRLKNP
jgi:hypothetical protein